MKDEDKKWEEPEQSAEPADGAELEDVARRVVKEEQERWETENRKRRRRKRGWTILGVIVVILALGGIGLSSLLSTLPDPIVVNEETIPLLSPIDEEAAARIDAMEGYDPEDTWTFYLYWVGSDLEAGTSNQLSEVVMQMIGEEVQQIKKDASLKRQTQLMQLSEEIAAEGLELPYTLFAPRSDLNAADSSGGSVYIQGDATKDLHEYMSVPLPENVRFVIQTGGAAAWADPMINPNRTQRFLLDSEGIREIYNGPISNMGHPDTLADFLEFAAEAYPADHEVVILWNHGGGDSGFGVDQIHGGDLLTLPELKEAFSAAFPLDRENPPLEMIYFACCLMSNAEAMDYLEGTAKYIVAAEEVTITSPGACSGWLEEFLENTGINGAQLGKLMIDNYMNGIFRFAEEYSCLMPTTLNLLDMRYAADVYDAYGDFAQAALKAQIEDPAVIGQIAEAASSSVFLANNHYALYNLIDLPLFMENAAEYFPEEAKAVLDVTENAMMYKRASGYLKDAGGISVYYPYHLESSASIDKCLTYIHEVSHNMDINAMYYYKMAGCMNETYQKYCVDAGYGEAQTLRYDELYRLRNADVKTDEKGDMSLTLTDLEEILLQDAVYELMMVDAEEEQILYLGEDRYVNVDGKQVRTEFPAAWVSIDGVPFALEIISTDEENIQYCTMVEYRSNYEELILNYNYETAAMTVIGVREPESQAATLSRGTKPLEEGEKISPVYKITDLDGGGILYDTGDTVHFEEANMIANTTLEDGTYIARIKLEDMRSDRYYSEPIRLIVENGKVTEAMEEKEYRVVGYH